jgi:hypothetical protein
MELISELPAWSSAGLQIAMLVLLVQVKTELRRLVADKRDHERRLRKLEGVPA